MKSYVQCILLLTALLFCAGEPPGASALDKNGRSTLENILVVSIDALHPDALLRSTVPNLQRLMRDGAYTPDGRSTDPPKTLIAHTAMFTGLPPALNGKTDNHWMPGDATVKAATIFNTARRHGFRTGYFYSKEKLGYLVNPSIDVSEYARDDAIDMAENFLKTTGRHFVFLHISGLDQVGPESGWLSPGYLEELSFIDDYLTSLIEEITKIKNYLVIVTSDHAGHERVHGSNHPEDYRLPLIICSDTVPVEKFESASFSVTDFKKLLENLLGDVASKNISQEVLNR